VEEQELGPKIPVSEGLRGHVVPGLEGLEKAQTCLMSADVIVLWAMGQGSRDQLGTVCVELELCVRADGGGANREAERSWREDRRAQPGCRRGTRSGSTVTPGGAAEQCPLGPAPWRSW
jgi:hypothetical protein